MSMWAYGGLAAFQVYTSGIQADLIGKSAALNEKIAEANAEFAELDAFDAEIFGFTQQARYVSVIDKALSEQNVAFAAEDVDKSYGTAADIQEETRLIGVLNRMDIQKQARERALGFKRQARDFRLGGFMNRLQAGVEQQSVRLRGITGAIQTGISGYSRSVSAGAKAAGGGGG